MESNLIIWDFNWCTYCFCKYIFVPERGKANVEFVSPVQWLLLFTWCCPRNATDEDNQDCGSYSKREKKRGWFSLVLGCWGFLSPSLLNMAGQIIQNTLFFLLYFIFLQRAVKSKKQKAAFLPQSAETHVVRKPWNWRLWLPWGLQSETWTWNSPINFWV